MKTYIYGAGKLGKQCMKFLTDRGISVEGYVVTKLDEHATNDKTTIAIESLPVGDNVGVIIAGNVYNSFGMHDELVKRGFTNYCFYDYEIERRIKSAISLVEASKDKRVKLLCDGHIARAVLDRIHGADMGIIFEAVESGTDSIIIIADNAERTADLYLGIRDKTKDINVYDALGQVLDVDCRCESMLEIERASNKCVLMIDENIPQYDMNAGNKLTYFYLLLFKKMGYSVWMLPLDSKSNGYENALVELGIHVIVDEPYGKLWLMANCMHFDVFFIHRPECAEYYLDCINKSCKGATIIYHPADLHFIRLQRQYELTGDMLIKKQAEQYKTIEDYAIANSDYIYVVGSKEKQIVEEIAHGKMVRDIPIFLYEENKIPDRIPASGRKDLIFVGGFGHPPNIDAVKWFAEDILPRIKEFVPDVICHVVGGNAPESLLEYASENLVFEGYISDEKLRELYLGCRLSIAPLRFGAGIKGKIIEAAYYGLPVVTTSIGAEGVHDAEKFITVADTAESFAEEIIRLYADFERIDAIAESTKEVIVDNYTSRVAEDILRADLEKEIAD